jgi:hypothetical protein
MQRKGGSSDRASGSGRKSTKGDNHERRGHVGDARDTSMSISRFGSPIHCAPSLPDRFVGIGGGHPEKGRNSTSEAQCSIQIIELLDMRESVAIHPLEHAHISANRPVSLIEVMHISPDLTAGKGVRVTAVPTMERCSSLSGIWQLLLHHVHAEGTTRSLTPVNALSLA